MATVDELRAKWESRRVEHARLCSTAPVATIAEQVLEDLASLAASSVEESVTLREAAMTGGYSVDHLQRLVASGQLENVGRKHRPRIRRLDVPKKPGYLPRAAERGHFSDRRRIVASVATRNEEAS